MKILHVVPEMDPKMGGVCQAVRTIITGLTETGVHNEVVSLDAPEAAFLGDDSFTTHAMGPGEGPWSHSAKLVPWLVENAPEFDVIIVHGLWLFYGYAVRKAMQTLKQQRPAGSIPKLFVMPHGMLDPYFQRATGRKLKALRNYMYWKLVEGKLINEADGLLFTCEEECRLAREPFSPYRPKKELVVGLGVEAPPVYTDAMRNAFLAKCPELNGQPFLLFLSRIHEKKGVDLLVNAYAQLVNAAATTGVLEPATTGEDGNLGSFGDTPLPRLVIAGPGLDTAYGQNIQQSAANVSDKQAAVVFPGMLTGDAKWGAFYLCEAFVLPSHQENFGIAIVEALACGKPVLISNQVNIWREIEQGGGGLVTDDTPNGTQQALDFWTALPATEKACMGRKAQQSFLNDFAVPRAANRLLNALSK